MQINEKEVTIKNSEGQDLALFVAEPKGEKSTPGLLVVHEIWGLNDQIKGVARRFAREGYTVIAPNFFGRYGKALTEPAIRKAMGPIFAIPAEKRRDPEMLKTVMEKMTSEDRQVVQHLFVDRVALVQALSRDAKSCVEFLQSYPTTKGGKLGITGFCMGGGVAFQIATQYTFNATVIFYGANPDPVDRVEHLKGPVFVIYAGEDKMLNAGIPALVLAMTNHKQTLGLKIYKDVQHGFFNEKGSLYNKEAAEDAWEIALTHFNRNLKNA